MSPFIHALFAAQTQQAITYEAIEVLENDFERFVGSWFASGGGGLNVTVPHKERAFAFAEITTPRATLARAVNTLSLDSAGRLVGDNTDGAGLLNDLIENYDTPIGVGIDKASVPADIFKHSFSNGMKKKWFNLQEGKIVKIAENVQDEDKNTLLSIQKGEEVKKEQIDTLKKRKLIS